MSDATFAAAASEHPSANDAVAEVVGEILQSIGPAADLVVIFATGEHAEALPDVVRTVRTLLNPRVLVGATAVSVVGGAREIEGRAGLTLWAARFGTDIEPIRLEAFRSPQGELLVAGGGVIGRNEGTLLLLADPFTFPATEVLDHLGETAPGVTIIGGFASAGQMAGQNVLILDDERFRDGAVGVWLPPSVRVSPVVSQGCRPIGQPLTVTRGEGNVINELAGASALTRLMSQLEALGEEEKELVQAGLHVGIVVDEHQMDFGAGDFLVRGVIGADRDAGSVVIGDQIQIGTTVQFHVRDARTADEDLRLLLDGRPAAGVLLFTCNGRGLHLFGEPHHDATVVADSCGTDAIAGMFCAGEFGPIGGQTFVHGFTASMALFS